MMKVTSFLIVFIVVLTLGLSVSHGTSTQDIHGQKTFIIITIDTEAAKHGLEKMIYGEINGEQFGIRKIMDICDEYRIKATFFVDVYEHGLYGEDKMKQVCLDIHNRGHDVQLHTHPTWTYDNFRFLMHQYSLKEQIDIIAHGKQLIFNWIGSTPIAHRAGSWSADHNTLEALATNDIIFDSSPVHRVPSRGKILLNPKNVNRVHRIGNSIIVPPTVFKALDFSFYQQYRRMDLGQATLAELKYSLDDLRKHDAKVIVLIMHSFDFINWTSDYTDLSPDYHNIDKFKSILNYISHSEGFRIITMTDLYHQLMRDENSIVGSSHVPYTGFFFTYFRTYQRFHVNWRNKAFFLIPLILLFFFAVLGYVAFRKLRKYLHDKATLTAYRKVHP